MKIFITGATGFVGTNLLKEIAQNNQVYCYCLGQNDHEILQGYKVAGEVENIGQLPEIDTCVHLAARVHQMKDTATDPLAQFRKINVDFAVDVAKECLLKGVKKFIFISSVKVYGNNPGMYKENDRDHGDAMVGEADPYGISKYEAEKKLVEIFEKQDKAKLIILRFPMVYGPGNKGNMIPLLKAARRKIPMPLGAASGKRSMLYVGNLISALKTVIEKDTDQKIQIFNITDGNDKSSNELYSIISRNMTGKNNVFYVPEVFFKIPGIFVKRINDIYIRLFQEYRFNSEHFQNTYGWTPPYTVEEGITETVRWFTDTIRRERS